MATLRIVPNSPPSGVTARTEPLRPTTPAEEADSFDHPPTILIIEDIDTNRRLLRGMLKATPYRVVEARRASEAFSILAGGSVDLIIVNLLMPEMSGLEFCRRIKANRTTQLTPILMLTSVQGVESEIAGIASGADEFLTLPAHPDLLRTRVRAMLRNKAAIDTLEEAETILFALAQAVEKRDQHTGAHCERVAYYSVALGSAIGLPPRTLQALHRGGYLHDIGKICVPDAILFKNGPLDEQEWVIMKTHTVRGEEICRPMKTLAPVLPIIRSHHERWDGSGYPDGQKGEEIPLIARVFQVADIYDALTSERPYKPALSRDSAIEILEDEARRNWRDPELVSLFGQCVIELGEKDTVTESSFQGSLLNMQQHLAG